MHGSLAVHLADTVDGFIGNSVLVVVQHVVHLLLENVSVDDHGATLRLLVPHLSE